MADINFMRIEDAMNRKAVKILRDVSLFHAAEVVALSRVSDLMVVDHENNFVGVLSEGDILRAAMPDTDEILAEGGSLNTAFGIFLRKGRHLADLPILPFVITEPIVVDPKDHIAKATTVMVDLNIRLLPVVKDGKLVGTISRADVCQAVVGNA